MRSDNNYCYRANSPTPPTGSTRCTTAPTLPSGAARNSNMRWPGQFKAILYWLNKGYPKTHLASSLSYCLSVCNCQPCYYYCLVFSPACHSCLCTVLDRATTNFLQQHLETERLHGGEHLPGGAQHHPLPRQVVPRPLGCLTVLNCRLYHLAESIQRKLDRSPLPPSMTRSPAMTPAPVPTWVAAAVLLAAVVTHV